MSTRRSACCPSKPVSALVADTLGLLVVVMPGEGCARAVNINTYDIGIAAHPD